MQKRIAPAPNSFLLAPRLGTDAPFTWLFITAPYKGKYTAEFVLDGKLLAEIVGNAIISHHANLQDYISPAIESSYLKRVQGKELPGYETVVDRFFQEVITKAEFVKYVGAALDELMEFTDHSPTQTFFSTKLLFSCLIDADRTDARQFDEQSLELETEFQIGWKGCTPDGVHGLKSWQNGNKKNVFLCKRQRYPHIVWQI